MTLAKPEDKQSALATSTALNAMFGIEVTEADLQTQVERQTGGLVSLAEETAVRGGAPEWKFRVLKAISSDTFKWNVPGTDITEVSNVVGIKGFPIAVYYGFQFYSQKEKTQICSAIALGQNGEDSNEVPLGPLTKPMYNGLGYRKEGEEVRPSKDLVTMNPYGSRGFSCVDCINNGLHTVEYATDKGQQTDSCGGSATMIFVVTELATLAIERRSRTQTVKWSAVNEMRDENGELIFEGPFLLTVSISKGSFYYKDQLKVDPIPADLKCLSEFWGNCVSNNLVTDFLSERPLGHLAIPAFVELWAAQPADPKSKAVGPLVKCLPAFRLSEANVGLLGTVAMERYLAFAYSLYLSEYKKLGGKVKADNTGFEVKTFTLPEPEAIDKSIKQAKAAMVKIGGPVKEKTNPFANAQKSAAVPVSDEDSNAAIDVTAESTPDEMPDVFSRS